MRRAAYKSISCSGVVALFLLGWPPVTAVAAPVFGKVFTLPQPDGTPVEVRIWGDEFFGHTETLDGYTVVRDSKTLFFCYARLSPDGDELVSTGIPADQSLPADAGLVPHLRISSEAVHAKVRTARARRQQKSGGGLRGGGWPESTTVGHVQGLTLLVDFADDPATISPAAVSDYCNQVGYTGYGNNGSVRDYYYDVSDGRLTYTNYVPAVYHRASHNKSYYTDPTVAQPIRAVELITEALTALDVSGFNFNELDSNHDGYIDAVNCLYAGPCVNNWSEGLWPHQGWVDFYADGVCTFRYQMSNLGSYPTLGTFCHENGHMLCGWPDLYDYDGDSAGVGGYCLMAAGDWDDSPAEPCAFLKYMAGWADVTVLTNGPLHLTATAGINNIFMFEHPLNPTEFYLIENRYWTSREWYMWDVGLAIWHIDLYGSNDWQYMLPDMHYMVTLVQADGWWDLENNLNYGDYWDLWGGSAYPQCTPFTYPDTSWWSGKASGLAIQHISSPAPTMAFDFDVLPDCNSDGLPDDLEVYYGLSEDCNGNDIPDECETDCNGNNVPDDCDVSAGASTDCQADGIPDDCQWGAWNDPTVSVAQNACANAQPVAPGIVYTGSTVGMTPDGNCWCANSDASPDVWYLYVPAQAGVAVVSLCGSSYDTVLSVHSGCPGTRENEIACSDEYCYSQSQVTFWAQPGYKYLIRIAGWRDAAGLFMLSLTGPPVAPLSGDCNGNGVLDACEQVVPHIVGQPASQYVQRGATASFSVSVTSSYASWYQWQKDGVNIPGAYDSSYTIHGVDTRDVGDYRAAVSTVCGTAYSHAAALAIVTPLTIVVEGGGSVILDPPGGYYVAGAPVTLVPQPSDGWLFSHWTGGVQGSDVPAYVTMAEGMTVTAVFEHGQRNLVCSVVGAGWVKQTPSAAAYAHGTQVLLEAQHGADWQFAGWTGNASGSDNSITVVMDRDRNITATFQRVVKSATPPPSQTSPTPSLGLCGIGAGTTGTLILLLLVPMRKRGRERR
ncbi:MAG TPA: M6 family metalloprotease domain-containing protein [Phycisphaerae bacterium]|nr:M6 family metalloprotease domain-containing protein [Phycisphaerae bacterium]